VAAGGRASGPFSGPRPYQVSYREAAIVRVSVGIDLTSAAQGPVSAEIVRGSVATGPASVAIARASET